MEKINIVENPTPDNYRVMWEKGLLVFDKVVVQLNFVEHENDLLKKMVKHLQQDKDVLEVQNEHFKKVLGDNGIECL
ncbi:hypothetical protein KAR91_02425 [Candidatus Pacearchaeota archaeon]|nr:hypothetical protein [Candidatus Pacearchaeota archaeon]